MAHVFPGARTFRGFIAGAAAALALSGCSAFFPEPDPNPTVADAVAGVVDVFLETSDRQGDVRAVLVLDDGEVTFERYIEATPDDYFDIRSVTKSVISTLIGIAIDDGLITGVDQTLAELLPDYADQMTPDVSAIPLAAILTHTANFAPGDGGPEDLAYWTTPDWVAAILADRDARGPGDGTFRYSDAGAHVLAAIVAHASGMSVLDFARERLFDPLGIPSEPAFVPVVVGDETEDDAITKEYEAADFAWPADPQEVNEGAALLKLRPQDLARIGMLFAQGGEWEGQRVVSEEWVTQATAAQVPPILGAHPESYGYLWWVDEEHGRYGALGAGGTAIVVDDAADLVVVVAAEIGLFDDITASTRVNPMRSYALGELIMDQYD